MVSNMTIKQVADALGVSKTAIRNYMDADFRAKYTAKDGKGVITITPDGCKVLSENIGKEPGTAGKQSPETEFVTIPRSVLVMLEEQLKAKDLQIERLQADLAKEHEHNRNHTDQLAALAARAQDLHAGTIKKQLPPAEADDAAPRKKWWQK